MARARSNASGDADAGEERQPSASDTAKAAAKATAKVISQVGHQTSLVSKSAETRFLDAGVAALAGASTAWWTATRENPGWWGLGLSVLGGFMAVEGKHELQKIGWGMLGANIGYLTLRLVKPDLRQQG